MNAEEPTPATKAPDAKPPTASLPPPAAPKTAPVTAPVAPQPITPVAAVKPAAATPEPKTADPNKAAAPTRDLRTTIIFGLAIIGIIAAVVSAYYFGIERKAQPPAFAPVSSPYASAIYANGIIESDQPSGSNINIYPEIAGPITKVFVHEGQSVTAGMPLLAIDDSVQKAVTEQLRLQAESSLALLDELKAQPRPETLAIAAAQVTVAEANLKNARAQYDKRRASFELEPKSLSKDVLDTAEDAANEAAAALDLARRQYDLTKAGTWSYDLAAQEKLYAAQQQAFNAANALLQKYTVKAPVDGVVLALNAAVGSYVSSQGSFNAYTQGLEQLVVMGGPQDYLAVRCYVDEILVTRLPSSWHINAQLSVRGTDIKLPLEFVRVQPYVSPKIELSNQREEKVDLRVLPVIFRFQKKDAPVYPGQLVDVFIGQK
jgi:HlyD family secretion protein